MDLSPNDFWRRSARSVCLGLATALLASCGGGVYVGYNGSSDNPPSVNLAVSPAAAFPGEAVDLAAAASDDYAVNRVDFYRSDSIGGVVLLGSDFAAPYGLRTPLPDTPDAGVSYLARAVDDVGQITDSAWLVVQVLP